MKTIYLICLVAFIVLFLNISEVASEANVPNKDEPKKDAKKDDAKKGDIKTDDLKKNITAAIDPNEQKKLTLGGSSSSNMNGAVFLCGTLVSVAVAFL
ncbi:hypothetical protein MDAP_001326 [Mitosporidium daphniae]